jgi:hypothetical protein
MLGPLAWHTRQGIALAQLGAPGQGETGPSEGLSDQEPPFRTQDSGYNDGSSNMAVLIDLV